MIQLALEYLDFAKHSLDISGDAFLALSDEFLAACRAYEDLRIRRFTRQKPTTADLQAARETIRRTAMAMVAEIPDAINVAAVNLAVEEPSDPKILDFIQGLSRIKL